MTPAAAPAEERCGWVIESAYGHIEDWTCGYTKVAHCTAKHIADICLLIHDHPFAPQPRDSEEPAK